MRLVKLETDAFFHIFNRGVDRRVIFVDKADYRRFYSSLFLFNDARFFSAGGSSLRRQDMIKQALEAKDREPLVRIMAFCLLPNHFHLLLAQARDNGISVFLHKVAMGYARYFNERYERSGRLFESTFKAVAIDRDAQFKYAPVYIHLNALDVAHMEWRKGGVSDWRKAESLLREYPWSSHRVYIGLTQELAVVDEKAIRDVFETTDDYRKYLRHWTEAENYLPTSLSDV